MSVSAFPLHFLLFTFAGWINQHQQAVIEYLQEENRVLKEQLRGKRLRLTDHQRRRLAVKGKRLGGMLKYYYRAAAQRTMGGCFPDASGADVCPFPEKLAQLCSFLSLEVHSSILKASAFSTKLVLCIEFLGHFSSWTGERDAKIRRNHGCKPVQLNIFSVQVTPEGSFW